MFWPTCNVVIAKEKEKKKLYRGWPPVWLSSPCRVFLIFCLPSGRRQSCFFLLYSLTTRQASGVSSCLRCFTCVPCTPLTVKHLRGVRKRSQRMWPSSLAVHPSMPCSTLLPLWFFCFLSLLLLSHAACLTSLILSNHSVGFYFWQWFNLNHFGSSFILFTMLLAIFPNIVNIPLISFFINIYTNFPNWKRFFSHIKHYKKVWCLASRWNLVKAFLVDLYLTSMAFCWFFWRWKEQKDVNHSVVFSINCPIDLFD